MNLYEFCRHQENISDVAKTSYPEYTVFSVTEDKDFQGVRKIGSQMQKYIKLKCMVDKKAMSIVYCITLRTKRKSVTYLWYIAFQEFQTGNEYWTQECNTSSLSS